MASVIESFHYKISTKFDCLEQICTSRKITSNIAIQLEKLKMFYNDSVSNVLSDYYSSTGNHDLQDRFKRIITAGNVLERLDSIFDILTKSDETSLTIKTSATRKRHAAKYLRYVSELIQSTDFEATSETYSDKNDLTVLADELQGLLSNERLIMKPVVSVGDLIKKYNEQVIVIETQKLRINRCDICGSTMTLHSATSELTCDSPDCGQIMTLQGVLYEDSQIYTQQVNNPNKTKKYDPNGHLSKWIDKILAKEDYIFDTAVVDRIDRMALAEYKRGDRVRPMINMRVEKVREWLQKCKFTDCYDHAPLLRKIITGKHGPQVVPPEFMPEELHDILIEASLALREFESVITDEQILARLGKDRVRNKFYYPYILWQTINLKIRDTRKRKILECIHLQSDDTLRRNDIVWKEICNRRGYTYYAATNNSS